MASVPTILADRSIRTGSTGPEATAASFGSQNAQQLDAFARGVEQFGTGARQASADLYSVQKHIEAIDNHRWALEAENRYSQALADFTSDPANSGKDSFHNDVRAFSQQTLASFKEGAPNPEALSMFMSSALPKESAAYSEAVRTVIGEKIKASAVAIQQGLNTQASVFRTNFTKNPALAQSQFEAYLTKSVSDIDALYGKTQPNIASSLKEAVVRDAIYGVADTNVGFARKLLDGTTQISGHDRTTLISHLDHIENEQNISAKLEVSELADDAIAAMEMGNDPSPATMKRLLDPATWTVFGKSADKHAERFAHAAGAFSGAKGVTEELKDQRPDVQDTALKDMKDHVQDKEALHSYRIVGNYISQNRQILDSKGVVTWLNAYNDDVQQAFRFYKMAATEEDKKLLWDNYVDTVLKFQGPAPAWLDPDSREAKRYQNMPDQHVLSMDAKSPGSAQNLIDTLNSSAGNPDKILETFHGLRALYPDEKFNLALSDLFSVKHDNPLNGQFRLLALNLDEPFAAQFAKAIANRGAIRGENPKDLEPHYDSLRKLDEYSAMWSNLAPRDAKDFGEAVVTYAIQLQHDHQATSPDDAVRKSAKLLLNSNMSFQKINGVPVVFPKRVADQKFDDETISAASRRLEAVIANVDGSKIDDAQFPRAKSMFPADPEGKAQAIEEVIHKDGFWHLSNDGTTLQLALKSSTGDAMYVFSGGRPIEVPLYPNALIPSDDDTWKKHVDPAYRFNVEGTNFPLKPAPVVK